MAMANRKRRKEKAFDPIGSSLVPKEEIIVGGPEILQLISSSESSQREYGCNTIAQCADTPEIRDYLLKNGALKAVVGKLADPEPHVRIAALGALRNLCITIGEERHFLEQLLLLQPIPLLSKIAFDSLSSSSSLPSSSSSSSPSSSSSSLSQNQMNQLMIESSFFILLYLSEQKEEATVSIADPQRGLIIGLVECLGSDHFSLSVRVAAAKLLQTLSDANELVISQIQNQQTIERIQSIANHPIPNTIFSFDAPLSSGESGVGKLYLLKALCSGILLNILPENTTSETTTQTILPNLFNILAKHSGSYFEQIGPILQHLNRLKDENSGVEKKMEDVGGGGERGEREEGEREEREGREREERGGEREEREGGEMVEGEEGERGGGGSELERIEEVFEERKGEWESICQAQEISLEILTNLFSMEEREEEEEEDLEMAKERMRSFPFVGEIQKVVCGLMDYLKPHLEFVSPHFAPHVQWAFPLLSQLHLKTLNCLSNVFEVIRIPELVNFSSSDIWKVVHRILNDAVLANDIARVGGACSCEWSLLRMCVRFFSVHGVGEANVHRIVPPGDVKQLMEFVKQFIEEEEIVVSILGIFGCVCKFDCRTFSQTYSHTHQIPIHENEGIEALSGVSNVVFGVLMSDRPNVVVEGLNSLFEIYGEDYHDELFKSTNATKKLSLLLDRLRHMTTGMAMDPETNERVQGALSNLEAFLSYKA